MPLSINEIEKLIKESIPDAQIEIKDLMGDKNHYSATIKSKLFNNLSIPFWSRLLYTTPPSKEATCAKPFTILSITFVLNLSTALS